uniref:DUF3719 domain-containing protein n=1 Tax=Setaria digitata TaxID=48799 RepID=A0A915Q190_9BILA
MEKQKGPKNHYQEPIISENFRSSGAGRKEHFLIRVEKSIYEGEPMSDEEVEAECRLWAETLPHLRVCGKSVGSSRCDEIKSMKETVIDYLVQRFPVGCGKFPLNFNFDYVVSGI